MKQDGAQGRPPRVKLPKPLAQQCGRNNDETRTVQVAGNVQRRQIGNDLHRLAKSHLVPQHAPVAFEMQPQEPLDAPLLVSKQLVPQAAGDAKGAIQERDRVEAGQLASNLLRQCEIDKESTMLAPLGKLVACEPFVDACGKVTVAGIVNDGMLVGCRQNVLSVETVCLRAVQRH